MGDDGSENAPRLRQAGVYIVGQDEKTSVVFGMAKAAEEKGDPRPCTSHRD